MEVLNAIANGKKASREEKAAELQLSIFIKLRHKYLLLAKTSKGVGETVKKFQLVESEIAAIRSRFPEVQPAITMNEKECLVKAQTELDGLAAIAKYLAKGDRRG